MPAKIDVETGSAIDTQSDEMLRAHEKVMNDYVSGLGMAFETTQEMLKSILMAVHRKCEPHEFATLLIEIAKDMPVICDGVEKLKQAANESQDKILKMISEHNETRVEKLLDGNDLSDAQAALAAISKPT